MTTQTRRQVTGRRHGAYFAPKDKCKADWNYDRGSGKRSKEARRRARQGS